jgi:hypothetical protein
MNPPKMAIIWAECQPRPSRAPSACLMSLEKRIEPSIHTERETLVETCKALLMPFTPEAG